MIWKLIVTKVDKSFIVVYHIQYEYDKPTTKSPGGGLPGGVVYIEKWS